ncbi:MAG: hypothetical protein JWN17_137 [Frankiales bacterium]|nr:hypothetical protein [Frankiales bacterium]
MLPHLVPLLRAALVLGPLGAVLAARLARANPVTGPAPDRAAVLGGLGGLALAGALGLPLFRGSFGHEDLAGLRACVVTDPLALTPEGLGNLLLFSPAAILAVAAVGRPWQVAAAVALLSVGVEAVQAVERVGVCDASDVVHNALGALVAALATALLRRRRQLVPGSVSCPGSC